MSRSTIAVIGLAAAAVLLCMGVGGVIGGIIASDHCPECGRADTIVMTDTLTVCEVRVDTLTRIVYRLTPVSIHDTVVVNDTVMAEMPYEYRHYASPDTLDVWYRGVDPRIDSVRIYSHTQVIEHTSVVRTEPPRNTITIGATPMDARIGYSRTFGRVSAGIEAGLTYGMEPVAGIRIGYNY